MGTVQDILATKQGSVQTVGRETSVYDAAVLMNEHKIGSVLVSEEGQLVGIFTERDILQRVVGQRRDVDETRVEEVMTKEVACCRPHTTIEEAKGVMKNRRIRRLPVLDDNGQILGIISIGDLNAHENNSQELTIHLLEQYLYYQT